MANVLMGDPMIHRAMRGMGQATTRDRTMNTFKSSCIFWTYLYFGCIDPSSSMLRGFKVVF